MKTYECFIEKIEEKEKLENRYKKKIAGIVKIEGKNYIIPENLSKNAKPGDKVSVLVVKTEAMVDKILEKQKIYDIAVSRNDKLFIDGKEIFIINKTEFDLINGNLYQVEVIEDDKNKRVCKIVTSIPETWNKYAKEVKIVLENGFNIDFKPETKFEVNALEDDIEKEIKHRKDLRNLFTITIDGEYSKDLDDAISVEKLENGDFKLYVHIADVTHFVKENSAIDREALERGTSVYFLDKVVPMIPQRLSNDLCSLNPNIAKLCLTCEMYINKKGDINIEKSKVYESVIKSNFRTTYKEVQDIQDQTGNKLGEKLMFGGEIDEKLADLVKNSFQLARILNDKSLKAGELIFNFPEFKIDLDENKKPTGFNSYPKYESNELIKALMVAANYTVSKMYSEDYPFVHRTHQAPDEKKIETLKKTLEYKKIDISDLDFTFDGIPKILKKLKGNPDEQILSKFVLRTLKIANYTTKLEGHQGLALTHYSHFTSPIRRYADLQIHRIIKDIINKRLNKEKKLNYDEKLDKVCDTINVGEKNSEKIESEVFNLKAREFLENQIGKRFVGVVTYISDKKISVELENGIIGELVIPKDSGCLLGQTAEGFFEINTSTGGLVALGSKVSFKLSKVDMEKKKIIFELLK